MDEFDPQSVVERYLAQPDGQLIASDPLRQRERGFRAAFPDATVRVERLVADGDFVAVHLRGRGTHLGVFQGCPPTGREWSATCTSIYRIERGRIADAWSNWDLLTVMEQLGSIRRVETVSA